MTDRFEFEIDTSHAIESWEQEVAANLRRRAEQEAQQAAGDQAAEKESAEAGVQ
jgi:3-ketosteroid 9alpha-monooxygenase subunit A